MGKCDLVNDKTRINKLVNKQDCSDAIRMRAVILGLILAVGLCLMTPFNNAYLHGTPLGGGHFPLAPFFVLICLTIILTVLKKGFKKWSWLNGKELLLVWAMLILVSGIAYTGLVRTFFINLTVPFHYSGMENNWEKDLQPLLPKDLYPQDAHAIEMLYKGLPGGRHLGWLKVVRRIPWRAWISPLLAWGCFIFACYGVMICIVNIFSRQWFHNERLNLPLLRVPEIMQEAYDEDRLAGFFTHPFMVLGLMVPVMIHSFNGLHFYHPEIPQIPTLILAGRYFSQNGLFSGFHKLKIYIYPAFIGFAFLTTRKLSFSFWFFFLFGGLVYGFLSVIGYDIPAANLGVTFGPTLSRPEETQMIGAYGVFFIFIIWLSREHLLSVVKQGFGMQKASPARTEWINDRISFWGAIAGFGFIIAWCRYFGMPLMVAFLVIGTFFMIMVVASRIICQGGLAYFTVTAAPIDGLLTFFGPGFFTHAGLLLAGVMQKVLFVDLRESLMPSLVHARKLHQKMENRKIIFNSMLLVLVLGVVVSFGAMLALAYKYGLRVLNMDWANRTSIAVYKNLHTLIEYPVQPGPWVMRFAIIGAILMLVLIISYNRYFWWPLHPIGYLTTYSSAMRILWFSFFVGWLCNSLCIRYGGITLYKKLRYFFVGFIIGDFVMGALWAFVGYFYGASYQVLPV